MALTHVLALGPNHRRVSVSSPTDDVQSNEQSGAFYHDFCALATCEGHRGQSGAPLARLARDDDRNLFHEIPAASTEGSEMNCAERWRACSLGFRTCFGASGGEMYRIVWLGSRPQLHLFKELYNVIKV